MQHIIVDEYFAAREVDLLHTEIGGGFEVWPQLGGGDLLKATVRGRRCRITVLTPKVANRALHHPQVFKDRSSVHVLGINKTTLIALLVEQIQPLWVHRILIVPAYESTGMLMCVGPMRISIIIPVYNEESTIGSLLSGLEDAGADELLVADGGSVDRTVEIASKHGRIVHTDTGRALQMNAAAQCASGDVLLFLHADARLGATALEV